MPKKPNIFSLYCSAGIFMYCISYTTKKNKLIFLFQKFETFYKDILNKPKPKPKEEPPKDEKKEEEKEKEDNVEEPANEAAEENKDTKENGAEKKNGNDMDVD